MSIEIHFGKDVKIDEATKIGIYSDIGDRCNFRESIIGDYAVCRGENQIWYAEIGKFSSIAYGARINAVNHPAFTRIAQHRFTYRGKQYDLAEENDPSITEWRKQNKVIIGNDVWIGHNAIIMPNVQIGNGAIIGSGAVVTHNVEPYSVVVGVPAKPIKKRFSDEIIEKIEKSEWWNWSHEQLKERYDDFKNIEEFVRKWC